MRKIPKMTLCLNSMLILHYELKQKLVEWANSKDAAELISASVGIKLRKSLRSKMESCEENYTIKFKAEECFVIWKAYSEMPETLAMMPTDLAQLFTTIHQTYFV